MNPFWQAITGRNTKATSYDAPFLQQAAERKSVDALGRVNYFSSVGNALINWQASGKDAYTRDGYSQNGVAYSIISYILTTAATVPWNVYSLTATDGNRQVITNQQLSTLIFRPNPKQSWTEFKTEVFGQLLTNGNAFLYANRLGNGVNKGKPQELWVLPAHTEVLGGGHMQETTGYRVRQADGRFETYEAQDVLHLKYWHPEDAKYGLSPIAAGYKLVTAANSGLEVRVRQYQNSGPAGLLFNNGDQDGEVDATVSVGIAQKIASFFTAKRRYTLPYLDTKVGYVQLGLSPVDLQVLDALDADKNGIADLFHFPAHLLNGKNGNTFNNVAEASKSLYTKCIIPLETKLREGLNHWLGAAYGDKLWIDFDLSGIAELQEDKKAKAEMLALCPWMTWRDKQAALGVEVDEKLDFYVLQDGRILSHKPLQVLITAPAARPATDPAPESAAA